MEKAQATLTAASVSPAVEDPVDGRAEHPDVAFLFF
jgi:hypothetical protein